MTCSLAFNIWKLYMRHFFFRKLNIALISIQCMLLPFVMVADSFGSVARSTVPHVLFIFWQLVRFRKCIRCLGSHLSYNFSFTKNILIWTNIKLKAKEKVLFFSWLSHHCSISSFCSNSSIFCCKWIQVCILRFSITLKAFL